jgi:hypothetical protein
VGLFDLCHPSLIQATDLANERYEMLKGQERLIGSRAEIFHSAFDSIRHQFPYASFEMQSNLAYFVESKINNMEFDMLEMYKEWMGQ